MTKFRPYGPADYERCLELFEANSPDFFAENERADYAAFLLDSATVYEVCLDGDRVVGAFGLMTIGPRAMSLRWILLDPEVKGRGLGSAIMDRVIDRAAASAVRSIEIAASQHSAPFFARFGANEVRDTRDGWGPGMHRVDMVLSIETAS